MTTPVRGRRLLSAVAVLGMGLLASKAAWAVNDCGAPVAGVVICNAANETPKPDGYQDTDGITYVGASGLTIESQGDGMTSIQGIVLTGTGPLTVHSHIDIVQDDPGYSALGGILVENTGGGPVTVIVDAGDPIVTNGNGVSGIRTVTFGAGAILIDSASSITTRGTSTNGVVAQTQGGAITIRTRSITALGAGSLGVAAFNEIDTANDDLAITVDGDVHSDATGILARGKGTIEISVGDVTTHRDMGVGIQASATGSSGDLTIVAGAVTTAGATAHGIQALSSNGDVGITAGDVTTTGDNASGVLANATTGDIDIVVTGRVQTTGGGISANAPLGAISIEAGGVTTTQDSGTGIRASTSGAGPLATIDIVAGRISTSGNNALGISGFAQGGAVTIRSQGVTTLGVGSIAIAANSNATTLIEVTGAISTQGADARGISANGGTGVSVTTQGISTQGSAANAIQASATSGQTLVTANGDITTAGSDSRGVLAISSSGTVTVSTRSITTAGQFSSGIEANNFGGDPAATTVTIQQTGTIHTTGDSARGVLVTNVAGATSITVGSVITEGANNSAGILASGSGAVSILATGAISTQGTGVSNGISVVRQGMPITVETQSVSTAGAGVAAIDLFNNGMGPGGLISLTSHDLVSAAGTDADAIRLTNATPGGVFVSINGIATSGSGTTQIGLFVSEAAAAGQGFIEVRSAGLVSTVGESSSGLQLFSQNNAIDVEVDSVRTTGTSASGVIAQTNGAGAAAGIAVRQTGLIELLGDFGSGITVKINGAGDATIDAHDVRSLGQGGIGIDASSAFGNVTVSVDDVQGGWSGGGGIFLGGVEATLTVRAGGTVSSLAENPYTSFATGSADVHIYGRIVGVLTHNDADDTIHVHNGGRLDLRAFTDTDGDGVRDGDFFGNNTFGAGEDLVSIEFGGTVGLPTVGDNGDRSALYNGLEQVSNAGLIDLRETAATSNSVDDRMLVTNYAGDGGRVFLDVQLDGGGPSAFYQRTDRLLVAGDVTGTILVSIKNAGGQGADTSLDVSELPTGDNQSGISIVQVVGNVTPDQVQLTGPVVAGAWQYRIQHFDPFELPTLEPKEAHPEEYDTYFADLGVPGSPHDFRLLSSFYDGVYEYAALPQGASLLGQAALTAVLDRPRDAAGIAVPGQSAALGAGDAQEAVRATAGDGIATGAWFAGFGEGLDVSPGGDADFRQKNYGMQAGYDFLGLRGLLGDGDQLLLGVVGTFANASLSFSDSESEMDLGMYGGGLYAGYRDGGLSANLVVQGLFGSADFTAPGAGVDASFDMQTLGVAGIIAHRFEFGSLYIEPRGELAWVHTWAEGFDDGMDVPIELDDTDSLVARSRVKLGATIDNVSPYLSLGVSHEFAGSSSASASGASFDVSTQGTAVEVGGGLTVWALSNNLTLELDASYRFGDEVQGLRATGGIKLSW